MQVLVTGGTGALGRQVVKQLREQGHRPVVLSRKPGQQDWVQGDLATGAGLAQAVRGMDAIVHAGSATTQPLKYRATDVGGTRRLLELARDAGIRHLVYVSIVGMEGVRYPYYQHKLAAEAVVKEGMVPWSILRATQFHTLMEIFLNAFSRLPGLMLVPYSWQFQPVDTRDVAARLAKLVSEDPSGLLPDFGGPEVRRFKDLALSYRAARRWRKRLANLPMPFQFSRRLAEGALLCPEHRDGTVTWEQYLERRYGKC